MRFAEDEEQLIALESDHAIKEQLKAEIVERVLESDNCERVHYLPHHPVISKVQGLRTAHFIKRLKYSCKEKIVQILHAREDQLVKLSNQYSPNSLHTH